MVTKSKIRKTCLNVDVSTWNYINQRREINESMCDVVKRLLNIPIIDKPVVQP